MKTIGTLVAAAAFFGAMSLNAFGQDEKRGLRDTVDRPDVDVPEELSEESDPITAQIDSLTPLEQVAQLMLVTLDGLYGPSSQDRALLRDFTPGGVIVPRLAGPVDGVRYVSALRALAPAQEGGIPLLIGAEPYSLMQGEVVRDSDFVQLPSLLSIAAAGDEKGAFDVAALVTRYLDVMGFNFQLGPTLALAPTLPEARGNIHNLGSDPLLAGRTAASMLSALAEKDILGGPTGFPGGGADRVEKGPAVLLTPKSLMGERELVPYRMAIEAGATIIHVGNTLVPLLEKPAVPSSLSPVVIQELLRGELGFEGVVVAGPMDDGDIRAHYTDSAEAAMLALQAGADMIYWRNSGGKVVKAIGTIAKAIREGEFDGALVQAALRRVLTLKHDNGLAERPMPDEKEAKKIEKAKEKFEESYRLERRSITLVQNRGGLLPLREETAMPMGIAGVAGVEALRDALEEYMKPIALQNIGSAKHLKRLEDFEIYRLTRHAKGAKTVVCVFSSEIKPAGQARLIREFKRMGAQVVAVLLGYPAILPALREADAIVLAYTDSENPVQTMRAVADVIAGNAPIDVYVAVRDLHRVTNEEIAFNAYDVLRTPTGRLPSDIDETFVAGFSVPYDPALAVDKVEWNFGDGSGARSAEASHAYANPGRYPVTLTVTDNFGVTASGTFHVVVE